jgi:phosphosulfolactate synthase
MDLLELPQRTLKKPRNHGITSVHDVGYSISELRGLLTDYHAFIDIAKLGIGSAYITPRLEEKIALYKEFDVIVYFGGTLFEKFYHCSTIANYTSYLKSLGISWLEVSTGTLDIPLAKRVAIVQELSQDFVVLAEVGTKDTQPLMPPSQWIGEIETLLATGCRYVIAEGRSSGTAGIYQSNGNIRALLISEILAAIDPNKIIFEAPHSKMQMFFINLVGPNVNLGNISPHDLLLVETQRCGLRSETFFVKDPIKPKDENTSA